MATLNRRVNSGPFSHLSKMKAHFDVRDARNINLIEKVCDSFSHCWHDCGGNSVSAERVPAAISAELLCCALFSIFLENHLMGLFIQNIFSIYIFYVKYLTWIKWCCNSEFFTIFFARSLAFVVVGGNLCSRCHQNDPASQFFWAMPKLLFSFMPKIVLLCVCF